MSDKLKPCPCGSKAKIVKTDDYDFYLPWTILCLSDERCPWVFDWFSTKKEAVKYWNNRGDE